MQQDVALNVGRTHLALGGGKPLKIARLSGDSCFLYPNECIARSS